MTRLSDSSLPMRDQLIEMARVFAKRQAELATHWLRVGYVQGNMNSDNCLLSGRTMDYGPFGFVERYESLWSPFTSDMERKFGFERQPLASQVRGLGPPAPPCPPPWAQASHERQPLAVPSARAWRSQSRP